MKCCSSPLVLSMMSLPLASTPLGSLRQREFLPKGEVGVPDDVAGSTEAADRVVGEPAPGESGAVPEADDAWVVEHVCVPGAA
jgi:hypothetical protein